MKEDLFSIVVDHRKCTGCGLCELACSMKHASCFRTLSSRIRVVRYQADGEIQCSPTLCMNCCDPPCEKVCPTGATHFDAKMQVMAVDADLCIGCKGCVFVCPFGACFIDEKSDKAMRCDQCSGNPACVETCPEKALSYVSNNQINGRVKRKRGFLTPAGRVTVDCSDVQ